MMRQQIINRRTLAISNELEIQVSPIDGIE